MIEDQICSKCGILMKKIQIKKVNSSLMIEFYCDKCHESITFYPDIDEKNYKVLIFF